jgi:integrase
VSAFLAAKKGLVKATTHYAYAHHLNRVAAAFPDGVTADSFGRWLHALPLSASSKNTIAGAAATIFRWAARAGLIPADPLAGFRKPPKASRGAKAVVTGDTHVRLYAAAPAELRPLLTLLRETGARPSELARLTAGDVDLAARVATLAEHKTAHATGRPRTIFLTEAACDVLRGLMANRPSGWLLLNGRGNPWTKDAVGHALRRVSRRAGVKGIAYGYRHALATDALARGVPEAAVAALLGHGSTAMVARHYGHLTSRTRTLLDALSRVRGEG